MATLSSFRVLLCFCVVVAVAVVVVPPVPVHGAGVGAGVVPFEVAMVSPAVRSCESGVALALDPSDTSPDAALMVVGCDQPTTGTAYIMRLPSSLRPNDYSIREYPDAYGAAGVGFWNVATKSWLVGTVFGGVRARASLLQLSATSTAVSLDQVTPLGADFQFATACVSCNRAYVTSPWRQAVIGSTTMTYRSRLRIVNLATGAPNATIEIDTALTLWPKCTLSAPPRYATLFCLGSTNRNVPPFYHFIFDVSGAVPSLLGVFSIVGDAAVDPNAAQPPPVLHPSGAHVFVLSPYLAKAPEPAPFSRIRVSRFTATPPYLFESTNQFMAHATGCFALYDARLWVGTSDELQAWDPFTLLQLPSDTITIPQPPPATCAVQGKFLYTATHTPPPTPYYTPPVGPALQIVKYAIAA